MGERNRCAYRGSAPRDGPHAVPPGCSGPCPVLPHRAGVQLVYCGLVAEPVGCQRARLLSQVGDGIGEDLLDGDALGAELVHPPPGLGAVEAARPDVVGERRDEVELGGEHVPAVPALDQEELGEPGLRRLGEHRVERPQLDPQPLGAFLQQPGDLVRREPGHEGQPGLERREVPHRRRQQLGQPVLELLDAGLGDRVHRALGALALAGGLLRGDQTVLLQRLDDGVQGAVVELDALLLAAGAQRRGDLVGMHRSLGQAAEDGQRERVRHSASGHGTSSIRNGVSGTEYVPSRPMTRPAGPPRGGGSGRPMPCRATSGGRRRRRRGRCRPPPRVKTRNGSRARTPRPKLVTPSNEPTWATCRNVENPDTFDQFTACWPAGGRSGRAAPRSAGTRRRGARTGRPVGSSVTVLTYATL